MELDLKGTQLSGFSLAVNTTLFSEETLENIVPDACPDILRILNTNAYVCVKTREAREGRLELRGVVYAQVLYIPDGEEGIRHIDVSIPFSSNMDHSEVHPGCLLHISPSVLHADARMLNPRKVYVRAEVVLNVCVYSPYQKKAVSGCCSDSSFGVQEKRESCQLCVVKGVQNKSFSFSDDLTLPGSKPDLEELLSQSVSIVCSESKVIGSKLIFKGQAQLTILYRDTDNQPASASFELPFSQIMEVTDMSEKAECDLEVILSEIVCQTDRQEPRIISVSMGFLAQAILRDTQTVELLSDLYSTSCALSAEFQEEDFCKFSGCDLVRQDIREVVETPVPVKAVVDSVLSIGSVSLSWEGKLLCFTADVRIHILYQSEDGEYYAITQALPAVYRLETDPDFCYFPRCRCGGERYTTPTVGGIEVRLPLDFLYRTEKHQGMKVVVSANLEEEKNCDGSKRPSIVLRMAEKNESLWDIAKAYSTTMEEIQEANDLPEYGEIGGRMLLIPKKR